MYHLQQGEDGYSHQDTVFIVCSEKNFVVVIASMCLVSTWALLVYIVGVVSWKTRPDRLACGWATAHRDAGYQCPPLLLLVSSVSLSQSSSGYGFMSSLTT